MNARPRATVFFGYFVAMATQATAHEAVPGPGGFASKLLHPQIYSNQLLSIVASILVTARATSLSPALMAALFVLGLVSGGLARVDDVDLLFSYFVGKIIGLLAAASVTAALPRMPRSCAVAVIFALGVVVGLDMRSNEDEIGGALQAYAALIVTSTALIVALGSLLRKGEAFGGGIALRVPAAWIAACAAMSAALALR